MDLWFFRARRDWLEGSLCCFKRSGRLFLVRHRSDAVQCRSGALGSVAFRGELDADCLRPKRPPICRVLDAERGLNALLPQMEEAAFLGLGTRLCDFDRPIASCPLHLLSDTADPMALPRCESRLVGRRPAECSAMEGLAGITVQHRHLAVAAVSATVAHRS